MFICSKLHFILESSNGVAGTFFRSRPLSPLGGAGSLAVWRRFRPVWRRSQNNASTCATECAFQALGVPFWWRRLRPYFGTCPVRKGNLYHLRWEPAPFREGPCAKQTLGRGCAFGQSPKKGRHRSLCVQLLLLATPCGASNVVEQVPQSRWRGTAPCAVPRSSPFLTIPSGASLYPTFSAAPNTEIS